MAVLTLVWMLLAMTARAQARDDALAVATDSMHFALQSVHNEFADLVAFVDGWCGEGRAPSPAPASDSLELMQTDTLSNYVSLQREIPPTKPLNGSDTGRLVASEVAQFVDRALGDAWSPPCKAGVTEAARDLTMAQYGRLDILCNSRLSHGSSTRRMCACLNQAQATIVRHTVNRFAFNPAFAAARLAVVEGSCPSSAALAVANAKAAFVE